MTSEDLRAARLVGRIPVRNLWLLMLYASDLLRHLGAASVAVEDNPDDIADLVAEILAQSVEARLKQSLTPSYAERHAVVNRVRGRIDLLETERKRLLDKGAIACDFMELTVDTARNRYVKAALATIVPMLKRKDLARRCRTLSERMARYGVKGQAPSRSEISVDRMGRADARDHLMVAASKLAFDLALPTEAAGPIRTFEPDKELVWIRKLYEKAVAGFYDFNLRPAGWRVHPGKIVNWQVEKQTSGIGAILPAMKYDIVLENAQLGRRIIVDTKFNSLLTKGWYRDETLRSGYLYQMYAYLRSQVKRDDAMSFHSTGLLLHPAIGEQVDETAKIQGHAIRFASVDLSVGTEDIRKRLIEVATSQAFEQT
ncbi:5-methylcytosine-specific restriction endonuclease system specificity protein McrC [Rhizobium sp. LCM 4573]|nr:5-methylcytosine-specific restriction endonuclease system specificity protein McrC [Rhizobium sp. LCM 4573]